MYFGISGSESEKNKQANKQTRRISASYGVKLFRSIRNIWYSWDGHEVGEARKAELLRRNFEKRGLNDVY